MGFVERKAWGFDITYPLVSGSSSWRRQREWEEDEGRDEKKDLILQWIILWSMEKMGYFGAKSSIYSVG